VPSSARESFSAFVPSSVHILVSSSLDDDSEDENPPLLSHLPPYESIEHEPAPSLHLSRWICSTQEATGALTGDPLDQRWTRSQFQ
jgi:hypothetical protein